MSARRLDVRLTSRARRDYDNILLLSRRTWGAEQQATYRAALSQAFQELVAYPLLGRSREELFPGCRSLHAGQHVLYYTVRATEIVIVRILHVRQDAAGQVSEP